MPPQQTLMPDYIGEGFQAVRKAVRRYDLAVIALGRIDVVVIVIQTSLSQTRGLPAVEHTKRHACLHAERLDAFDHGNDGVYVAILGVAPCGAHAIAGRAGVAGLARLGDNPFHLHQLGGLEAGVMVDRLAAIATILRTSAGLDAEKPAELYLVGIEMFAVDGLRMKQQIIEGGLIECQGLFPRPILVDVAGCRRNRRRPV
jgi:hypothetical protein